MVIHTIGGSRPIDGVAPLLLLVFISGFTVHRRDSESVGHVGKAHRTSDEIAAAKVGKKREEHDGQRHSADVQDGRDVQARAEENDGEFQNLLRRELHAGRGGLAGLAVAVDEHTDKHGDDGRADDVERQKRLDALGEQRDDEREHKARRVAFDLIGKGVHGDLTASFFCLLSLKKRVLYCINAFLPRCIMIKEISDSYLDI